MNARKAGAVESSGATGPGDDLKVSGLAMSEKPVELDAHRGMAAQKATELRRLLSEVSANEQALRTRQQELEDQLLASPALSWEEAAEKARYLLSLFANSLRQQNPRRQKLIAQVLDDFARLASSQKD